MLPQYHPGIARTVSAARKGMRAKPRTGENGAYICYVPRVGQNGLVGRIVTGNAVVVTAQARDLAAPRAIHLDVHVEVPPPVPDPRLQDVGKTRLSEARNNSEINANNHILSRQAREKNGRSQ
jgi:hypothetical protein